MCEARRALMFADPDQAATATSDPVAQAFRSERALDKVARHTVDDDSPAQSFATLMAELATIVRSTCRTPQSTKTTPTFDFLATLLAKQQHMRKLLG